MPIQMGYSLAHLSFKRSLLCSVMPGCRDTAAEVGRTTLEGGKAPDTAASPTLVAPGAPDELLSRAEREEVSAQGPLQALAEKAKGAVEFVR